MNVFVPLLGFTQLHVTRGRAEEAVRAEFRTEFLLRLCDCARDGRNPKDGEIPEAPLHPEYRVKQFVREHRLAQVTAAADRLHAVLSPPAGEPRPTGEQIRDAVREACANRGPAEVDRLRDLYRERWLKGAKGGEPRDLDKEISAKLGDSLWLRKQCEAVLHPPRGQPNGCEIIFREKASGGRWERPELHRLLGQLRKGDVVVVWKLDRLARSLKDVLLIMERIQKAKGGFRSLTEAIDTTTPAGRMMMQMVGAFAEFEREVLRERTKAGLKAARKDGRVGGRRPKLKPEQQKEIVQMVMKGKKTAADAARLFRVHPSTVSRILQRASALA